MVMISGATQRITSLVTNAAVIGLLAAAMACATQNKPMHAQQQDTVSVEKNLAGKDTVRIANDSLEYEIIIIDAGFNTWLSSRARPRQYYGLTYLETRNKFYVMEWNRRVLDPFSYKADLYQWRIDYDPNIRYGYEVNYLLYNYLVYFQQQYKQKL